MMGSSERNALPTIGAAFFREAGDLMFQFVIDPGNIVGPRLANKTDSEKHPDAWAAFVAAEFALETPAKPEPVDQPAISRVNVTPEMEESFGRLEEANAAPAEPVALIPAAEDAPPEIVEPAPAAKPKRPYKRHPKGG